MSDSRTVDPAAVVKTVEVHATPERAFRVFTQEMDAWWPRTHHIGDSPMKRIVVEPHPGGAIYTVQEDDTNCPWASVLVWEPPRRFVFAWRITLDWQYEPDVAKSSEVEVRFAPSVNGTLVTLEHRYFERHGEGFEAMRDSVGGDMGWGSVLEPYVAKANETAA